MLKEKITRVCLPVLMCTYCLCFISPAYAQESCNVNINIATDTGDREYPPGWRCECDPYILLEFDDDFTLDTIYDGESIDVYVTGGCAPFIWSVSGSGLSFDTSETDTRVNTLTAAADT